MIRDKHSCIDIETLGTNSNSPIIQIGLVVFTVEGGISLSSQINIDFEDALKHGEPDGATIRWWLQQPKEAQETLAKAERSCAEAADMLRKLIEGQNPDHIWSHATFDPPIIDSMYRSLGMSNPINFERNRDIRTLEAMVPNHIWGTRKTIHHNALGDATYQAQEIIRMLKTLNGVA